MAAYLVKVLPWAAGIGVMGSGTLAFAAVHSSYEVGQENQRLKAEKCKLHQENQRLCQTLLEERDQKKELQRQIEFLEKHKEQHTKFVGVSLIGASVLGGAVGYFMH